MHVKHLQIKTDNRPLWWNDDHSSKFVLIPNTTLRVNVHENHLKIKIDHRSLWWNDDQSSKFVPIPNPTYQALLAVHRDRDLRIVPSFRLFRLVLGCPVVLGNRPVPEVLANPTARVHLQHPCVRQYRGAQGSQGALEHPCARVCRHRNHPWDPADLKLVKYNETSKSEPL